MGNVIQPLGASSHIWCFGPNISGPVLQEVKGWPLGIN